RHRSGSGRAAVPDTPRSTTRAVAACPVRADRRPPPRRAPAGRGKPMAAHGVNVGGFTGDSGDGCARGGGSDRRGGARGTGALPHVLGTPAAPIRRRRAGLSVTVVALPLHRGRRVLPYGRALHDGRQGTAVRRRGGRGGDPRGRAPRAG